MIEDSMQWDGSCRFSRPGGTRSRDGGICGARLLSLLAGTLFAVPALRAQDAAVDAVEVFEVTSDPTNTGVELVPLPEEPLPGEMPEPTPAVEVMAEPVQAPEPVVEVNGVCQKPSWSYATAVDFSAAYDSNIFIQEENAEGDLVLTLSPWVAAGWGDFREKVLQWRGLPSRFHEIEGELKPGRAVLFGRYEPTATAFLDHPDENSLDHDLWLHGGIALAKLTLAADARLQTLSEPDVDLGRRADRTVTSAGMRADYTISSKTSADAEVKVERRDYQEGRDSTEASLRVFAERKAFDKVRLGFGGGLGFIDGEDEPEQRYEQVLARVRYRASRKFEVVADGGVEFRQASAGDDQVNPVFSVAGVYAPIQAVRFTLEGSRRTTASASFEDGIVERTGVRLSALMQVRRRYFLTLRVGYEHDDYERVALGGERSDDRLLLGAGIAAEITPWFSLGLGISYQDVDSSADGLSYERVSVEASGRVRF